MATLQVPGDPFAGGVSHNATNGLGRLQAMPQTKWGKGQLIVGMTEKMASAVDKWQKETDAAIVQDAVNQTKNELEDLQTNEKDGWANQVGGNAVNRPDGKSLVEEYNGRGKNIFDNRRSQLHTLRQKQMYDAYAQAAGQKLSSDLQAHMVKQQAVFEKATHTATFNGATEDILSGDPEKMRSGYAVALSELQWQADRSGLPVDVHGTMGKVNVMAIEGYIDGKNPEGAAKWLKDHKDDMSPLQIKKAEGLIKAGRATAAGDAISGKLLKKYEKMTPELLKEIHDIKDENVRAKVAKNVDRELKYRDAQRKLEVKEIVEQAFNFVDSGQDVPDTLMAELHEKDPDTWRRISKVDTNGRPKQSDLTVLSELQDLMINDPAAFSQIDVAGTFGDRLTSADVRKYTLAQSKAPDNAKTAFLKGLTQQIMADKKLKKSKAEIIDAAGSLWDDAANMSKTGVVDKAAADHITEQLLSTQKGWFNFGRGYELVTKAKEKNKDKQAPAGYLLGALADGDFESDRGTNDEVNGILAQVGLVIGEARDGMQTASAAQAQRARAAAEYGFPAAVTRRAYQALKQINGREPTAAELFKASSALYFKDTEKTEK